MIPVVALSQLSRAVEKRDDKRPMLSDSENQERSSRMRTWLCSFIVMIIIIKILKTKTWTEIIIAKQRNGPIGTVNLVWMPEYTRFVNAKKD